MSNYQPHCLLVTGAAGFIGANFVRYLLEEEPQIKIISLDKLTYSGSLKNLENLPNASQHHFIQGDINDKQLLLHIMQHHHIDSIIHFAAESHVDRSIAKPDAFIQTNIVGTFNLLEAARHHWFDIEGRSKEKCRFHHISTDEVFGSLSVEEKAFTESHPYRPRSPYAASKASADHLVWAYHHTYDLPVTLSNCSNNYGPYQHQEKFIPTVILSCLQQKPIPIYGTGKNIRDWLYVHDHCSALLKILKQGKVGEAYNIGGKNEWENLNLAEVICAQMDELRPHQESHKNLLQFVSDRKGHDFRYAIDCHKMSSELNWQPTTDFIAGLQKTIEFYLQEKMS